MVQLSCKFGESNWNPDCVIVLTNSFGTNHVLNEHEDTGRYDAYGIPSQVTCYSDVASLVNQNEIHIWVSMITNSSEIMLFYSYPASLVNQNEIPIDLSC